MFKKENVKWYLLGIFIIITIAITTLTTSKTLSTETDLAPEGWETIDSGYEQIYGPRESNLEGKQSVSISVIHYNQIDDSHNILQLEALKNTNDLDSWIDEIYRYYEQSDMTIEKNYDEKIGTILVHETGQTIDITAFIRGDEPLSISLIGTGELASLDVLKTEGYFESFQQVVLKRSE
mgnify:CR=1 FL=1